MSFLQVYNALEEKGLPYTKHVVMLPCNETSEPWYMRINPNGTVPAIKHGSNVICDSDDIINYVEVKFPGKALLAIKFNSVWFVLSLGLRLRTTFQKFKLYCPG